MAASYFPILRQVRLHSSPGISTEHNLAPVCNAAYTRSPIYNRPEVVHSQSDRISFAFWHPYVYAHAHPQASKYLIAVDGDYFRILMQEQVWGPLDPQQRLLNFQAPSHCRSYIPEADHKGIPLSLHLVTSVYFNKAAHKSVVLQEGSCHGFWKALPLRCRSLYISENQSDVSHRRLLLLNMLIQSLHSTTTAFLLAHLCGCFLKLLLNVPCLFV
mmetsp:Transcript_35429/g.57322  ORF Transcript_35429/g.57322 Transcript_35429/m.57322 type:complete len:215 (-) Transcript_35429:1189-1833(-)